MATVFLIVIGFAFSFGLKGTAFSGAIGFLGAKGLDSGEAASMMQELVKNNLTTAGTKVEVTGVEYKKGIGLYEVQMKLGGKADTTAFLSKDGKYFIKEAVSLEEIRKKREAQEVATLKEAERKKNLKAPKTKKPEVDVFIMSHCPFGTQVQKGFLPVMKTLGQKADIEFKFVDYLMHGKKELDENLNQYCIEKEGTKKHLSYLECFLGSSGEVADSTRCMKEAGISENKIKMCTTSMDKKFSFSDKLKDKSRKYPIFDLHKEDNDKYDVKGSPTVVVNGTILEPNRDANSILKAVCSGFEDAPKECEEGLSTKIPSPGFGGGVTTASNGGCAE